MPGTSKSAGMKTISLYRAAERRGITVDHFDMPVGRSASAALDGELFVALDPSVSGAEERVCLAHELGHCETMSFYNLYSPLDIRGKHERRADRWAIGKLVPRSAYFRALRAGYTDVHALAEYFGVTEDFMKKAADYYSGNE